MSKCYQCLWQFKDDFTLTCLNLESLALGPDFSHCDMVVNAPNLNYFEFLSSHVPEFFDVDGFPCIKKVDMILNLRMMMGTYGG